MADDLGERTEDATPRRLREARGEGRVARSSDLTAAIALIGASFILWSMSGTFVREGGLLLQRLIDVDVLSGTLDPAGAWQALVHISSGAAGLVFPVLLMMLIAVAAAQLLQFGLLITFKPLEPNLERLDPIQGLKRIFGISGLIRVSLDSMKVLVVLLVAGLTAWQYAPDVLALPLLDMRAIAPKVGWMLVDLSIRIGGVLLLLGVLDLLYQRWKYKEDLKMTRQQVKDDMKDAEGDPGHKRRRMRMMQQLAMQRIASSVPEADVIVTNPEHLAVAIKYDSSNMAAPVVVAKGAELVAFRIRQLAERNGVPIVERKPLARALYAQVEVGEPIPADLFKAVAELLAWVYQLEGRMAS
ncbi:MAG: flagellar biosynthesis protein FlhB [Phycisphaerae bacterium]|nr:flagellar biosynthesis protein FlhB [Phycisphaerae bacterium]MDG1899401.1 flagellar biosynthesis protein FlhB [Phycisphaerales bacterium]|tara:strand:- start:3644 stop:4714 length:1071 start_codon:yes stop_codon:yes gene_type:complete